MVHMLPICLWHQCRVCYHRSDSSSVHDTHRSQVISSHNYGIHEPPAHTMCTLPGSWSWSAHASSGASYILNTSMMYLISCRLLLCQHMGVLYVWLFLLLVCIIYSESCAMFRHAAACTWPSYYYWLAIAIPHKHSGDIMIMCQI